MRSNLPLALACCFLLAFLGCGDDDDPTAPATPVPLAQIMLRASGGGAVQAATMFVSLKVGPTGEEFAMFDRSFNNAEADTTLRFDASNTPAFDDAVATLTNGTDDRIQFARQFPGGGGGSNSNFESRFLDGGLLGDLEPDLAGTTIEYALLHVDVFELDTPGSNPGGTGNWTDYVMEMRLVLVGRR